MHILKKEKRVKQEVPFAMKIQRICQKFVMVVLCLSFLFRLVVLSLGATAQTINEKGREKRIVALTFDDGPHPAHTDAILDILENYHIKATFFVIGQNAEQYPSPLARAASLGHLIGNHSYDHKAKGKTEQEVEESLRKTSDIIESITGKRPGYFRAPEGKSTVALEVALQKVNLYPTFWTIDTKDWAGHPPTHILQNVKKHAKSNEIILMHDYNCPAHNTIKVLPAIIEILLAKGYQFVTIEEYFQHTSSG